MFSDLSAQLFKNIFFADHKIPSLNLNSGDLHYETHVLHHETHVKNKKNNPSQFEELRNLAFHKFG